jgi:hypothetical protein
MSYRRPLSLIESPSLCHVFGSNYMTVWAPISSTIQHVILRPTSKMNKWIKSFKICSALVFWIMVQNRTSTFHWLSSPITIVTNRPSRCHLSKHSMDNPITHHWVGLSQVRELSLAPILWQRQKRMWSKSMQTYWLPNTVRRATPIKDVAPWNLKLVIMYTFGFTQWRVCVTLAWKES